MESWKCDGEWKESKGNNRQAERSFAVTDCLKNAF